MYWLSIIAGHHTEWVLSEGSMTGQREHRTEAVHDYLEIQGIRRLRFSAMSPDVRAIQHA